MILYHGSNIEIKKPDLQFSKPYKDFGSGFYLTADRKQAGRRTSFEEKGNPIVSSFLFDEKIMSSQELNIKVFEDYSEEWALFILKNRNQEVRQPSHNYDIVYGPIADDGVTFQLRRYQRGAISIQDLIQELRFAKGATYQFYFGTDRALQKLKFYDTEQ